MDENTQTDPKQEIAAIGAVYEALKGLDATVQWRVLEYVAKMLRIDSAASDREPLRRTREDEQPALGHWLVAARHGIVYLHAEALQRPDWQRLVGEDDRERCVASEPLRVYLLAP